MSDYFKWFQTKFSWFLWCPRNMDFPILQLVNIIQLNILIGQVTQSRSMGS